VIVIVTCTGDRPEALSLLAYYISRQTYQGDIYWVISDDGVKESKVGVRRDNIEIKHTHITPCPGTFTLRNNLRNAFLYLANGDIIFFMEDDDWYHPDYIEYMLSQLGQNDLIGLNGFPYYNVYYRCFGLRQPVVGAAMGTSVCRQSIVWELQAVLDEGDDCIDTRLWERLEGRTDIPHTTVDNPGVFVGIKGMPGRPGWMSWHRQDNPGQRDINLSLLERWTGMKDARAYREFMKPGLTV